MLLYIILLLFIRATHKYNELGTTDTERVFTRTFSIELKNKKNTRFSFLISYSKQWERFKALIHTLRDNRVVNTIIVRVSFRA